MFEKMRYESSMVTFTEVPNEITLCFNMTGCPHYCRGCFEPWLREDYGDVLDYAVLKAQIDSHKHITCVCFMGGDRYITDLVILIMEIKREYPNLKFAMYSGAEQMDILMSLYLDYYKIGPYIAQYGPLNEPTTNQRFYKKENDDWIDVTYLFQQKKI